MSKILNESGYVLLADGIYEHRVICAEVHGEIPRGWEVHHVNFVRSDNRSENLIALPKEVHQKLHTIMRLTGTRYDREVVLKKLKAAKRMRKKTPNCASCRKKRRNCKCAVFKAQWRLHWPSSLWERAY